MAAALLGGVMAAGCGTPDAADSGSMPCAPLATTAAAPIALGSVLGIGQDADGTIYVLDEASTGYRVFVSDSAGNLVRKAVTGSSSGGQGTAAWYVAIVSDPAAPFMLKVDGSSGTMRIGIVRGVATTRDFTVGETGDVLTVEDAGAIAGMTALDLAGTVTVEYWAGLPDGRTLIVTRPEQDWDYSDFRLFLGTQDRMLEHPVSSVVRARDGGTTTIVFTADGGRATAFFPSALADDATPTLTMDGATVALTLVNVDLAGGDPFAVPADFAYLCL